MKKQNQPEEEICIKVFVQEYSKVMGMEFEIYSWPDSINPGDLDALAKDRDKVLAIEHTSIDSYEKQREDDAVFNKVFASITKELDNCFEGRITVIVPVKAVRFKRDQISVQRTLLEFLNSVVPGLAYGKHVLEESELGFSIVIWREKSDRNLFGFARFDPEDQTFKYRFKDLVERKTKKLERYGDEKTTKILLIENDDIGLMSPVIMREAWQNTEKEGIKNFADQVWYVDSCIKSQYCLHLLFSKECLPMEKEYILASSVRN